MNHFKNILGKSEIQLSVYDNGDIDLESGMDVPQEVFNEIAFELSKNFNLLDLEILEKKKKAFQFKSKHKSKKGGLTESGRKAYNKATGSNLKRPQPGGGKRKKSFCARSKGQMKMHGISCKKDPKKRVCLARKRWACKSESEAYFESLKKAKIFDFKTKQKLADLPTGQLEPTSQNFKWSPQLEAYIYDSDHDGYTRSKAHNIKIGKKAYKAYVRRDNNGVYDVEIDHDDDAPGEAYDKAWTYFENIGYMNNNGFDNQGNPIKTQKSELNYFQELKKAIIRGPSGWWDQKQTSTDNQPKTKFKTVKIEGARTTYKNTPETDKMDRVMHTVDVEVDGVPMVGQFEATDPIDAMRAAHDLIHTNPEIFKPKNEKSELIKDSDQERRKTTNPFGRRKSWDAIRGAYLDRRKSQRPIGFFDRRKGKKDRRMPNQPVSGRRVSRMPLKTVSAPQASPNAIRSTVSMQMEKSPFNQLYGQRMDQPIKAYRDQEDSKVQRFKNVLLEKIPDQDFKNTVSKFIDFVQKQPDRHYRSGAYLNQKRQQVFTPRTRHIRKIIESNNTYDKEKNSLRSKDHSFQFDPKTKKLTFQVHQRHGSAGDFKNKFFGTKWEFNPQTNQVTYLGRTDRRQDQRRKKERRSANQFNPAFPNRRTSERRGPDRRVFKSEFNGYFENLKKAIATSIDGLVI